MEREMTNEERAELFRALNALKDEEQKLHDCSSQLEEKEKELSSTVALINSLTENAHNLRSEGALLTEKISNLSANVSEKVLGIRQRDRELASPVIRCHNAADVLMVKRLKDLCRNDKRIVFRGPNSGIQTAAKDAKLESTEETEEPPRPPPKISIGHFSEFKDNY